MRAAPACQVSLQRFGVWRGAVFTVVALGVVAMAAWTTASWVSIEMPVLIACGFCAGAVAVLALSLARRPPVTLRWDGQAWHLAAVAGEPVTGELRVEIDLGPWMLLRFVPHRPAARPRVSWLPLQRRGLEPQWHALRCAVYSPRPPAADDAAAGF